MTSVAESEYAQQDIAAIRTQLDNVEGMTRLAVAANPNSQAFVESILRGRANAARIYLLMGPEPTSQTKLQQETGLSAASVSKVCSYLYENGLIMKVRHGKNLLWGWSHLESTLKISRVAKKVEKNK